MEFTIEKTFAIMNKYFKIATKEKDIKTMELINDIQTEILNLNK